MTDSELMALVNPKMDDLLLLCIIWAIIASALIHAFDKGDKEERSFVLTTVKVFAVNTAAFAIVAPIIYLIQYTVVFDLSYDRFFQATTGDFFRWGMVNSVIAIAVLVFAVQKSLTTGNSVIMLIASPVVLVFLSVAVIAFGVNVAPGWMPPLVLYALLEKGKDLGAAMIFLACCIIFVLWYFDVMFF